MKIKKMYLILVGVMFLFLIMCGCQEHITSEETKDIKIKIIVKKSDHAFWEVVNMGAQAAAKEFNIDVEFDGPTNEEDVEGQIRMVDTAIDDNVDAIVLAASDYEMLVDVSEKAVNKGIPVIIIDSNINSNKTNSFVGTDNIDAGKLLGTTLINTIGEKGDIAIINFVKGAATANEREVGLLSILNKYPKINITQIFYCNSDENLAKKQMVGISKDTNNLDAVVCLNAYATVGAARAVEQLNLKKKIIVIGFDIVPEEVSFLEKGIVESLVIQNPFSMGYLGVKSAFDVINHKPIPKIIKTKTKVITKENMYLPENQKLVFPFID